jgi:hypothetical protein
MKIRPELKMLKEMGKKLEKVEFIQYLILSSLIPRVRPTREEKKVIQQALKSKKWVSEKELFKVLRK